MIQRHPRSTLQIQSPTGSIVSPFQPQQHGYAILDAAQQQARAATMAAQTMILNSTPVDTSLHGAYSNGQLHHRVHSAIDDRGHMDIEEDEFEKTYGGDYVQHHGNAFATSHHY
jgi:hypothetical protein